MSPAKGKPVLYLVPKAALAGPTVEKINLYPLFQLGSVLGALRQLKDTAGEEGTPSVEASLILTMAELYLESFLKDDHLKLRESIKKTAVGLLAFIKVSRTHLLESNVKHLETLRASLIKRDLAALDNILMAELPMLALYLVRQKGGYDTSKLIDEGEILFPAELATKVPEALADVKQGSRCIAFELPTAAGYHFHRANEAVLRRYWDAVTSGAPRPTNPTAGRYLKELEDKRVGDPLVISSLKDLVKLRRNPLAHPDESLEDVNAAITVLNAVHTAVTEMLKRIP